MVIERVSLVFRPWRGAELTLSGTSGRSLPCMSSAPRVDVGNVGAPDCMNRWGAGFSRGPPAPVDSNRGLDHCNKTRFAEDESLRIRVQT
jgi:hypothetical protein